jgi:hypothetical protein
MNRIILFLFLLCTCTTFAIAGESKKNKIVQPVGQKNIRHSVKNNFFKLALLTYTTKCPSGYSGTTTYWIVYDDQTGAIYGAGSTGGCIPVNEA